MFFSAELLAKRDSGFGLLWLAATLGSKSTFRKLPKRSVLVADINQLCELIAEPAEPLALRLSSNLMVGVARYAQIRRLSTIVHSHSRDHRVYKVKQELFMADVTMCVSALKKMMKELQTTDATDARLQLPNPVVRASAITLAQVSQPAIVMAYDSFITDWDEYLRIEDGDAEGDDGDGDYSIKAKQVRARKEKAKNGAVVETARAELCTLAENHEHLLSASFNMSFNENGSGDFSMPMDEYDFGNNFLPVGDAFDMGALGEELSRELNQAWGQPSQFSFRDGTEAIPNNEPFLMDLDGPPNLDLDDQLPSSLTPPGSAAGAGFLSPQHMEFDRVNTPLPGLPANLSPGTSFSRQLLSQDDPIMVDAPLEIQEHMVRPDGTIRTKRARLLLDARTELTDEELKVARACYLKDQTSLRRELFHKKLEKECNRVIEDLVWSAPSGVQAPALKAFWQTNFKSRVESRVSILQSGLLDDFPVPKRRRISPEEKNDKVVPGDDERPPEPYFEEPIVINQYDEDFVQPDFDMGHRPSSEEPGRARQHSQPPALDGGQFGFGDNPPAEESQRSSLFPWDHAAASSSSVAGFQFPESDQPRFETADVRVRNSKSRRGSSLVPSRQPSSVAGGGTPPVVTVRSSNLEDYEFDVPSDRASEHHVSQASEINLGTLEKNSLNFLEYTKMQQQVRTDPFLGLDFDDVVPAQTSTRHVAAAAFYHCLVLGTKDLLALKQPEPYGPISIIIK
ncbi:hypothetical protein BDN72DRAFT_783898 [Pluteus cervinus]|uniref:Uncharacterized protein n=1 Tax=Pluteus cervinus TaxID=181527 RepID=A0ACD3BFX9_9AGAR|nr:hypothetical protein BDN72DRAFT_783898 [Pluteus cervinus]